MAPISENPFAALTNDGRGACNSDQCVVRTLPGNCQSACQSRGQDTRRIGGTRSCCAKRKELCGLPTPTGGSQSALDPCSQGAEVVLPVSWIVCCGHSDPAFWGGSCKFWPAHPFPFHRSPGPCFRHTWRRRVGFRLLHNGAGDTAEPSESRRRSEANGS